MFIGQSHRFQHIWSLFNVYLLNMIGSFLLSRPLIVTVSLRLRLELASWKMQISQVQATVWSGAVVLRLFHFSVNIIN